jgi:CheY-like chemotaxis protein
MTNPRRTQPRILVIEDDAAFGPMLRGGLLELSTDVALVECVDDAVEALMKAPYDLVVVDIWLPKTCSALREKRELEVAYDALTEELIQFDDDESRKAILREKMEQNIAEARTKLERRGGLMILESLADIESSVGAILFLTAIGNSETRQETTNLASRIGCKFVYLVKPQTPEAIHANAKALLSQE